MNSAASRQLATARTRRAVGWLLSSLTSVRPSAAYCDTDGITRGKAAGTAHFAERLEGGIGLTVAMQAFTMLDHLAPVPGMGPVGEIRLVADPTTFVVAPYAAHTAVVLVDMMTTTGEPYDADGRHFLRRMVERAAAHDLAVVAAFEPEWSLAREWNTWVAVARTDNVWAVERRRFHL